MSDKNTILTQIASRQPVKVSDASQAATLHGVRIVFLTNSMTIGGMEAHLEVLTRGLTTRGVAVTVICPDYAALEPMREALSAAGANVYYPPGSGRSPIALLRRFFALIKLLRAQTPFLFHLHLTGSDGGTMPVLAAKLAGAKVVVRTEHLPPDMDSSLRRRLLIRLRDVCLDRVICVSQANLEQYATQLGRRRSKLTTIHNSVDPSRFGPHNFREKVRELIGASQESIVVGAVSRMSESRKGIEHFIEMAKALSNEVEGLKFFIVGDGRDRTSLETLADGYITFLGEKPARRGDTDDVDVADCFAAMDIFVQPSLSEGGPITVLEAMATGLPVVSTEVGMVKESITDGLDGLIVPPGDTVALERAVRSLIQDVDYRRRLGLKARETIQSRFGEGIMIARTLELYSNVVESSAKPSERKRSKKYSPTR